MVYNLEEIKDDLATLIPKDFYIKYILRSDNWYFESILGVSQDNISCKTDDFKSIISNSLKISFNNIAMVGSGKIGFSLTPRSDKLFNCFSPESDVDIAIISNQLFHDYWDIFRSSYSDINSYHYKYISRGIYRGYISEFHLSIIDECRKHWSSIASSSKKALHSDLYIKHDISYRLYRSWEDFEEYHIQALEKIKRGDIYGSTI